MAVSIFIIFQHTKWFRILMSRLREKSKFVNYYYIWNIDKIATISLHISSKFINQVLVKQFTNYIPVQK